MFIRSMLAAYFPRLAPAPPRSVPTPFEEAIDRDIGKVNLALLPMLGIALIAATYGRWATDALGAVVLWSIATLAVGATLGFLFAIPKSGSLPLKPDPGAGPGKPLHGAEAGLDHAAANGRANTNLEEVSDWLSNSMGRDARRVSQLSQFVLNTRSWRSTSAAWLDER